MYLTKKATGGAGEEPMYRYQAQNGEVSWRQAASCLFVNHQNHLEETRHVVLAVMVAVTREVKWYMWKSEALWRNYYSMLRLACVALEFAHRLSRGV